MPVQKIKLTTEEFPHMHATQHNVIENTNTQEKAAPASCV